MDEVSSRVDWTRFSTARTQPCGVAIPTVVEPSYAVEWVVSRMARYAEAKGPTLIASMAYSTV